MRLLRVPRGIGNSIRALLLGLSRLPNEHEYFLYADAPEVLERIPASAAFTSRVIGPKFYPFWEHISFPSALRRDRIDVVHCPANTAPLVSIGRTRLVVTVHDVIFLQRQSGDHASDSFTHRMQNLYYRLCVPTMVSKAQAIITDSQYSRSEILRHMELQPAKVCVVELAAGEHFRELSPPYVTAIKTRYNLDRFFIAPAAQDPRKNTRRVLECFQIFQRAVGDTHELVLFGLNGHAMALFTKYSQELNIQTKVRLLGFIDEDDLVALYNAAEIVLYPSLYEGFGLPVLEAMSCAAPIITSNTSSIPELAGDAAILVNPTDAAALAAALVELSSDPEKRQNMRKLGRARAQRYSADRMASECLAVYAGV